jgi:hypothetical protein
MPSQIEWMLRPALPDSLGLAFSVGSAYESGVTRSRLSASDLDKPFHGVRARRRDPLARAEDELLQRAIEYSHRMLDGEFFCGITSAVAWGLPLPRYVVDGVLDVGVFAPRRSPRSRGIRGHMVLPTLVSTNVHPELKLRVAGPASTWAMLGAVLRHPYDLVAAGDAVLRQPRRDDDPPALGTLQQVESVVAAGRRPGVVALRAALPRLRKGSESHPESWTRCTLVDGGLPEPRVAFEIHDRRGRRLACVDLAYPEWRIAIEYEGEHHLLDPDQWARDIARYERLTAEGWLVIRVTKDELFRQPGHLVARVRRALRMRAL